MKKVKWYRFTFADGFVCVVRNLSAMELKVEERKHGKLISKTYEGTF